MNSRLTITLITILMIGCTAPIPKNTTYKNTASDGKEHFYVKASSSRNTIDRPYVLIDQQVKGDDKFKIALASYIKYVLDYQGYNEAIIDDPEAIYVSYSFIQPPNSEGEKCLELVAFSKRVYDSTKREIPLWIADSCHVNSSYDDSAIVPMFALSLRDVVGKNSSPYQYSQSFQMNDELVKNIRHEVEPTIEIYFK